VSHSKGLFLGQCPGNWASYGRVKDGVQQLKCSKCGRLSEKKMSRCWFFHDWKNKGRARDGYQNQTCNRCGHKRVTQARKCWMFHRWHVTRDNPVMRCAVCGTPRNA
jgi:hypothetical protein